MWGFGHSNALVPNLTRAVKTISRSIGAFGAPEWEGVETRIQVGLVNSRGITSRGVYDGGTQEREMAGGYWDWARQAATTWPRTGRLLRLLAESYEREAREHDARAELSADTQ